MKWILIIILYGSGGKGSVDHIEFNTKQACDNARSGILRDSGGVFGLDLDLYCYPAGVAPDGKVEK